VFESNCSRVQSSQVRANHGARRKREEREERERRETKELRMAHRGGAWSGDTNDSEVEIMGGGGKRGGPLTKLLITRRAMGVETNQKRTELKTVDARLHGGESGNDPAVRKRGGTIGTDQKHHKRRHGGANGRTGVLMPTGVGVLALVATVGTATRGAHMVS
jgi:hypothetical protein